MLPERRLGKPGLGRLVQEADGGGDVRAAEIVAMEEEKVPRLPSVMSL